MYLILTLVLALVCRTIDGDSILPREIPQPVCHHEVLELDSWEGSRCSIDWRDVSSCRCIVCPQPVTSNGPQYGSHAIVVRQRWGTASKSLGEPQCGWSCVEQPGAV